MIPLSSFKATGYDDAKLKAKFTEEPRTPEITELIDLIDSRIRDGMDHCQVNARVYRAIDEIMSRPLRQTTYELAQHLIDHKDSLQDIESVAREWGLTHMLTQAVDPRTGTPIEVNGRPVMGLDLPVFHDIYVPLSLAYTKSRWATMFNAIDQEPLYNYSPAIPSDREKVKCGVVTGVVRGISAQMGYRSDERQSILQMLTYGTCYNFPEEPWYQEKVVLPNGEKQIVKSGVRFAIPHPGRTFIDLSCRTSCINSDTGVTFGGWWDAYRWGAIMDNPGYWLDPDGTKVSTDGGRIIRGGAYKIYETLYPCNVKFPIELTSVGQTDNRTDASFTFTRGTRDQGVVLCKSFHKLIPSQYKLFDYSEPVWFQATTLFSRDVIKFEPLCYRPIVGYFYDKDDHRNIGSSLPLEIAPFEDKIGNLLKQFLLTLKRNLNNVVFFNKDGLTEETIAKIENLSGRSYQQVNFVPISLSRLQDRGVDPRSLLMPVNLPMGPTGETLTGIKMVLDIVDRLNGFSSAEVGSTTPHEITATEDTTIKSYVTERRRFTLGFHDDGMEAKKRMIYDAVMNYGEDKVFSQIAVDQLGISNEAAKVVLQQLGFVVESEWNQGGSLGVVGPRSSLMVEEFSSGRDGINRASDTQMAKQMLQVFQSIFSNPAIAQAAGVQTMISWFNNIAIYAGLPTSMRLKFDPSQAQGGQPNPEQMMQAVQQMVQQMTTQQMGQLAQAVTKQLAELAQTIQKGEIEPMQREIGQAIKLLVERVSRVEGALHFPPAAVTAGAQPGVNPGPPPSPISVAPQFPEPGPEPASEAGEPPETPPTQP